MVDLWGDITETAASNAYGPDSLVHVFSSGKSVASILIAIMVDKGLMDYSDLVTKHWKEFGQNDKDKLTIADIMRHEGGLAKLSK